MTLDTKTNNDLTRTRYEAFIASLPPGWEATKLERVSQGQRCAVWRTCDADVCDLAIDCYFFADDEDVAPYFAIETPKESAGLGWTWAHAVAEYDSIAPELRAQGEAS